MGRRCQSYDWTLWKSGHPIFRGIGAFNWGILKEGDQRLFLLRNLQTFSCYFARITRQTCSVSTEQYRVGVKKIAEKIPGQTSSHVDKSISRENDQSLKKLDLQEVESLVRNPTRTEGIGTVRLFIGSKDYSCRCTWTTSKWLEGSWTWLPCGRNWWNLSVLENQHHF